MRFFPVEPKSCFHAGDFVARRGAIASICRRPASLDLGLAFRWPISRARRQMRGDRIKCLGLRTYRTSCINATDSICRRARMESQSVVKLGQWARVDDKSNRSRSACGNTTCGTFQHFNTFKSHPNQTKCQNPYCLSNKHVVKYCSSEFVNLFLWWKRITENSFCQKNEI